MLTDVVVEVMCVVKLDVFGHFYVLCVIAHACNHYMHSIHKLISIWIIIIE